MAQASGYPTLQHFHQLEHLQDGRVHSPYAPTVDLPLLPEHLRKVLISEGIDLSGFKLAATYARLPTRRPKQRLHLNTIYTNISNILTTARQEDWGLWDHGLYLQNLNRCLTYLSPGSQMSTPQLIQLFINGLNEDAAHYRQAIFEQFDLVNKPRNRSHAQWFDDLLQLVYEMEDADLVRRMKENGEYEGSEQSQADDERENTSDYAAAGSSRPALEAEGPLQAFMGSVLRSTEQQEPEHPMDYKIQQEERADQVLTHTMTPVEAIYYAAANPYVANWVSSLPSTQAQPTLLPSAFPPDEKYSYRPEDPTPPSAFPPDEKYFYPTEIPVPPPFMPDLVPNTTHLEAQELATSVEGLTWLDQSIQGPNISHAAHHQQSTTDAPPTSCPQATASFKVEDAPLANETVKEPRPQHRPERRQSTTKSKAARMTAPSRSQDPTKYVSDEHSASDSEDDDGQKEASSSASTASRRRQSSGRDTGHVRMIAGNDPRHPRYRKEPFPRTSETSLTPQPRTQSTHVLMTAAPQVLRGAVRREAASDEQDTDIRVRSQVLAKQLKERLALLQAERAQQQAAQPTLARAVAATTKAVLPTPPDSSLSCPLPPSQDLQPSMPSSRLPHSLELSQASQPSSPVAEDADDHSIGFAGARQTVLPGTELPADTSGIESMAVPTSSSSDNIQPSRSRKRKIIDPKWVGQVVECSPEPPETAAAHEWNAEVGKEHKRRCMEFLDATPQRLRPNFLVEESDVEEVWDELAEEEETARREHTRLAEEARMEFLKEGEAARREHTRMLEEARMELLKEAIARMEQARMEEARLEEARLEEARLEEARLEEARLEEARLEEARLEEARLEEARLEEARLARPSRTRSPEL